MPVTPNLTDPVYHPLNPRNSTPVTPMEQLAIGGINPYRSSYWEDFKASLGFLPNTISPEEAVLRRENARRGIVRRNIAGGLGFARGSAMVASYAGGTAMTGGLGGMVAGGFLDTIVGGMWRVSGLHSLQESMKNSAFAEDISQVVARGTGATLSGHGFKRKDVRELQGFLKDASGRFDVSIEDIQKDVVGYVNAGLFKNVSNVDEFKKQFGQLKKNVTEIIKVLGTTQEEAMQMMSEVNQSGISQGALAGGLQNAQLLSRRTGISTQNFIGAGVSTAQSFQGTGITAGAGFSTGMNNFGSVQHGVQQGTIGSNTLFQLGGVEGAAFAATQQQASFLNSPLGTILSMASMKKDGTVDVEKFLKYSTMNTLQLNEIAANNMLGQGQINWIKNKDMIKSELMSQSSDYMNLAMIQSTRTFGQTRGMDPQFAATQYGGFTNETYRLVQGMLMASPGPQGTMSEQNLARMANAGLLRQYQRGDTAWTDFWRGSAYEWGEFGETVTTPFRWTGNQVTSAVDYLSTPKGELEYFSSDISVAMRAMKRGAKVGDQIREYGMGIYTDETWGADTSEIMLADIRKGVIREDSVEIHSLKEIYDMDSVKEAIIGLEGGMGNLKGEDLYKWGSNNIQNMMEIVHKVLPGVQGYQNALILEDRKMRYGEREITVVRDELRFKAEGESGKEMIKFAQIIARTDRSKIDALDSIAGVGLRDIQDKLFYYQNNNKAEFNNMGATARLMKIEEASGITREMIKNADDPEAVMHTLLLAAENAGLGVDLKALTRTDYGTGIFGKMAFKHGKKKNINAFVNKIDEALNEVHGDLGSAARKYLKDGETQGLLNELFMAYSASGGPDASEVARYTNKIIAGAKSKSAKADLTQLFNMEQADLYENFKERFGIDQENLVSDYEKEIFYRLDTAGVEFDAEGKLTPDQIKKSLSDANFTDEEIAAMNPATLSRVGTYALLPTNLRGVLSKGGPNIKIGEGAVQENINTQILLALQTLNNQMRGGKGAVGTLVDIYNNVANVVSKDR